MPLFKLKKCLKMFAVYSTILELQKVILENCVKINGLELYFYKRINKEFL